VLLAFALLGFVVAGCGQSDSVTSAANVGLPVVEVLDVATSAPVQLNSLLPADRALLVWFWAPH
jgi:hypothetical protein